MYIYTHIHTYTCTFSLWFIIGYWIWFPVLYSRTLLFILYIVVFTNPKLLIYPFFPFSFGNHKFAFCPWVFFCFVHLYYILDVIYMWHHMVSVFLCLMYFTVSDNLLVHSCCCRWHYFILSYGWVILLCVCVWVCVCMFVCICMCDVYIHICTTSSLYIFWWPFRLLPCLVYCK